MLGKKRKKNTTDNDEGEGKKPCREDEVEKDDDPETESPSTSHEDTALQNDSNQDLTNGSNQVPALEEKDKVTLCEDLKLHRACEEGNLEVVKTLLSTNPSCKNDYDSDGSMALHVASKNGFVDIVRELLQCRPNVDSQNDGGLTPVHCAVLGGHVDVLKVLLEIRPDLGLRTHDQQRRSPLLAAVHSGQVEIVDALLKSGVCSYVNMRDGDGLSGLHLAVQRNSLEIARSLLDAGADIDIGDDNDRTVLHRAVTEKQIEFVKRFLACGANQNATDADGQSPLHLAVENDFFPAVRELLRWNADPNSVDDLEQTPLMLAAKRGAFDSFQELMSHRADVKISDKNGYSALIHAVKGGHEEILDELILKHEVDVNIQNLEDGRGPLHYAMSNGDVNIVEKLLQNNAKSYIVDNAGTSPLLYASKNGHTEAVRSWLRLVPQYDTHSCDNKCDWSVCSVENSSMEEESMDVDENHEGMNALHVASQQGHVDIVKALLEHGAVDVNLKTSAGDTALHLAVQLNRDDVVKELLNYNADVNQAAITLALANGNAGIVDELLKSTNIDVSMKNLALHEAAKKGNVDVMKVLLKHRADVNKKISQGKTVLHLASESGNVELVKELLKHDVDVNAKDHSTETALHLASKNGHALVIKELVKYNVDVNGRTTEYGKDGPTALFLATREGYLDVVTELLRVKTCQPDIIYEECSSSQLDTALSLAACKGFSGVVLALLRLENRSDPNLWVRGKPQVYWALEAAKDDSMKDIVQVLHTARNTTGSSLLHWAVQMENVQVVREIIAIDKSLVNRRDIRGSTPLHLAAAKGNMENVWALIDAGADPNLCNYKGLSALHVAAWKQKFNCVTELCQHTTDGLFTFNPNLLDEHGLGPLHWAAVHGHAGAVKALKECEADVSIGVQAVWNIKNDAVMTPLDWAVIKKRKEVIKDLVSEDRDVFMPLLWAVTGRHYEMVKHLVRNDEHANFQHEGIPLLHLAITRHHDQLQRKDFEESSHVLEIIKSLVKEGADLNLKCPKGKTPLEYAMHLHDVKVVKYLAFASDDVKTTTFNDISVFHILAMEGHDISEFVTQSDLVNHTSFHDNTALNLAAALGDKLNVDALLNFDNQDVNHANSSKQTALHGATQIGNDYIVEKLLAGGVDVEMQDCFNMTAIHHACIHGHTTVIEKLMTQDLHFQLKDKFRRTCLDYAVMYRREEMVKLLLEKFEFNADNFEELQGFLLPSERCSLTMKALHKVYPHLGVVDVTVSGPQLASPVVLTVPRLDDLRHTPGIGSVKYSVDFDVETFVEQRMKKVVEKIIKEAIELFTSAEPDLKVNGVGSSFEGTRVGFPDELDFLVEVDTAQYTTNKKGEGYLEMKTSNKVAKRLKLTGIQSLGVWMWTVLMNYWFQKNTDQIKVDGVDGAFVLIPTPPQRHPDHKTCSTWLLVYNDENLKDFPVSVDVVPAIRVEQRVIIPRYGTSHSSCEITWDTSIDDSEYSFMVPKMPSESGIGAFLSQGKVKVDDLNLIGRQSFPTIERGYLRSLDKDHYHIKEVLMTAKCLRKPEVCGFKVRNSKGELVPVGDFVTSYHLKTVFMHFIPVFQNFNMSLGKMVLLIYEQLETCLRRGVLPMVFKERRDTVNVLFGSRRDVKHCAVVAEHMVTLIRALYERDYDQAKKDRDTEEMSRAYPWFPECLNPGELKYRNVNLTSMNPFDDLSNDLDMLRRTNSDESPCHSIKEVCRYYENFNS